MPSYELEPGATFAGYTIEQVLATGGMGVVYLAQHPNLPRSVALKLLHRTLTTDDYVRARFELEAEHAARLEHPNIVAVFDRGRDDDQLWIAMQYVPGTDAARVVADSPLDPQRSLHIVTETGKALDYAHRVGVLHRDVKPANILLSEAPWPGDPERVLLTDFGIAKALGDTSHLTQAGMVVATLRYAAPEQILGASLDHRADVYSLGCTLYHLLTGHPPYPGPNPATVIHGHINMPSPHLGQHILGLPAELDNVIARALAKNPQDRYESCRALTDAAAATLPPAPRTRLVRDRLPTPDTTSRPVRAELAVTRAVRAPLINYVGASPARTGSPDEAFPTPSDVDRQEEDSTESAPATVTVAVIDDHDVVREGLVSWCNAAVPPITVGATYAHPSGFLERHSAGDSTRIDAVILDLQFGEGEPLTAIDTVRAITDIGYRVIVYSMRSEAHTILDCLDSGAVTYLTKSEGRRHMVAAIRAAVTDAPYISPSMAGAMSDDNRAQRPKLSEREREVLLQWFRTESKAFAAKALYITPATINSHLDRIRTKYAAAGRPAATKAALVARAIQDNIISIDEL